MLYTNKNGINPFTKFDFYMYKNVFEPTFNLEVIIKFVGASLKSYVLQFLCIKKYNFITNTFYYLIYYTICFNNYNLFIFIIMSIPIIYY